jgi:hypothetical protein
LYVLRIVLVLMSLVHWIGRKSADEKLYHL